MSFNFGLLIKAAFNSRPPHLLLFHGSGSVERQRAVLELAVVLNCMKDNKPCGECPACKKIQSGNHPDFQTVRPLKTSIGIEQVLSLQEKMYKKIYEGKYRICLIDEADRLTLPAANALLKIAEEPPENTVIVLSTGNVEGIIPTLRSRAQSIYFPPPSGEIWGAGAQSLKLGGGDPDLGRRIEEFGAEKVWEWLANYIRIVESGDFPGIYGIMPSEKEECLLLLQALAVCLKDMVAKGKISPEFLKETGNTAEIIKKQVNHRLAMEVLALKHMSFGGNEIG